MSMIRYQEPWDLLTRLQGDINQVFNSFAGNDSSSVTADWIPAVDITEYGDRFELEVDLPGIDSKEVDITLDNGVLILSGERKQEKAVEEGPGSAVSRRIERGSGKFYRRFIVPDTVDADGVEATSENGVLRIKIPKQAKAQPRRIQVAA